MKTSNAISIRNLLIALVLEFGLLAGIAVADTQTSTPPIIDHCVIAVGNCMPQT